MRALLRSGVQFQPTLPARGATRTRCFCLCTLAISTHAPRTGSDDEIAEKPPTGIISTHAPRTGSDIIRPLANVIQTISTHAPRTGSDARAAGYSAAPSSFQPTLPARGATHFARITQSVN